MNTNQNEANIDPLIGLKPGTVFTANQTIVGEAYEEKPTFKEKILNLFKKRKKDNASQLPINTSSPAGVNGNTMPQVNPTSVPSVPSAPVAINMEQTSPITNEPTYNEFIKPRKDKTGIYILLGALVILLIGGLAYYFIIYKQAGNKQEEPQSVVSQPVENTVPEASEKAPAKIDEDEQIKNLEEIRKADKPTTQSVELQLNSLEIEKIDEELQNSKL